MARSSGAGSGPEGPNSQESKGDSSSSEDSTFDSRLFERAVVRGALGSGRKGSGQPLGAQPLSTDPPRQGRCAGRIQELERLGEHHEDALRHGPRLSLIEGPPGIGKTTLLTEFRSRVRLGGGVVLEGRCRPGQAFGPFAEIVDAALRFLEEVGAAPTSDLSGLGCFSGCHRLWHHHSGPEGPESGVELAGASPETAALERRLRFFDSIQSLLLAVARVRVPVVALHHLERADRGTMRLLEFLLDSQTPFDHRRDPAMRALFVATVDQAPPNASAGTSKELAALRDHPHAQSLMLGALDVEGVRAYLSSEETVRRVLSRTGGSPEAIELLLLGHPLSATERLAQRMDALSETGRRLVEAASILGRPALLTSLARVAEVEADTRLSAELGRTELLGKALVDGQVRYEIDRSGDGERCRAGLSPARLTALHRRAAELYDEAGEHEEAVHHALHAGDLSRAMELALRAAETLAARHAHNEAAALLKSLLSKAPEHAGVEVHERLADLYRVAGNYGRALEHARAVYCAQPEAPASSRRVGHLLTISGALDEAATFLPEALAVAEAHGSVSDLAEVQAFLAELHYQRGGYDEALAWAEKAREAAAEAEILAIEIHARNTLGKVALARKDPRAAAAFFEANRDAAAAAELGHQEAQAHTNLGVAMLLERDLAAAEASCEKAIEVARRASDTRDRAIATENLAVLAHLARDYAKALRYYHDAVRLLKRLGNRAMLARVAHNLGELYLCLGERGRARALCDFADRFGKERLPPSVFGEGLLLRGRVDAADGKVGDARSCFLEARAIFERLGSKRANEAGIEMARLCLVDGDVKGARAELAALPVQESPKRAAELALVAADVERAAGGETLIAARRAVELAEHTEDDELLLPALIRHARALGDGGEVGLATRVLERAQRVEARLGEKVPDEAKATWSERRTRGELSALEKQLRSAWSSTRRGSVPPPALDPQRELGGAIAGGAARGSGGANGSEWRSTRKPEWRRRYPHLIGRSPALSGVMAVLDKVAPSETIVLIRGESGTGKEVIAEAIHRNSPRRDRPLIKVNCAALVETLLLSELFGHERGAFTGAQARKKGRFELADGGTIFLDEIGDISAKTQVALLRVLQERQFERVGGTKPIRVDVRILTATHRDLEAMVSEGTFREDLYYRLRGVMVEVPPLRRRLSDLPDLCAYLLRRIARERDEPVKEISEEALSLLGGHRWPGNVRELENVLRSATLFSEHAALLPEDFAAFAGTFRPPEAPSASGEGLLTPAYGNPRNGGLSESGRTANISPGAQLEDMLYRRVREGEASLLDMKKIMERECIVRALSETDGNITRAASLLGMKRPRLSQLVKRYGLNNRRESKS